jgi:hypothetical protein
MSLIGCLAKAADAILPSDKLILQNMVDKFVKQGEPRDRAEVRAAEAMLATYEAQRADIAHQIEKQLGAFGYAIGEPTQKAEAKPAVKTEPVVKTEPASKEQEATQVAPKPEARITRDEPTALDTRVAELRPKLGEKQATRLDKLLDRYKNGEIDAQRLGDELETLEKQAFPPEQGGQGVMFSRLNRQGKNASYFHATPAEIQFIKSGTFNEYLKDFMVDKGYKWHQRPDVSVFEGEIVVPTHDIKIALEFAEWLADAPDHRSEIPPQMRDGTFARELRKASDPKVEGQDANTIRSRMRKLFVNPAMFDRRVTIVQDESEIPARFTASKPTEAGSKRLGFYDPNTGHVWLIASYIQKGRELGVFLHEVGGHMGMMDLLGKENYDALVNQIKEWANGEGSIENEIAAAAWLRVSDAETALGKKMSDAVRNDELIAYFTEEAVNHGINPTAIASQPKVMQQWFIRMWNAVKAAVQKLGLDPKSLTAQDVVDLAYGAARLQLSGSHTDIEAANKAAGRPMTEPAFVDKGSQPLHSISLPKGKFSKAGEMVNDYLLDTKTTLDKVKLGWMTLEHMVARMGDRMPALEQYVKAMHKMQGDAKDIVYKASFIDMEWGKFNDENAAKLGDVMVRSTLANFDPTVDKPKTAEEQAIVDDLNKVRDEQGKADTAVALFKSVRDFYKQLHEQKLDILRKASKDGKLDARTERMFAEVKGPYFPLMRMGKWYAVGMSDEVARLTEQHENGEISPANKKRLYELRKDGTHYTTRSFDTRSEAEKFARESGYDKTYVNTQEERTRQAIRSLPDFEQFEAYLGGEFDSETRRKLKDIMAEMYFDLLPQNSGLKHAMKREGVFGATFGRREFAKSSYTSAHLISRLRNANDLNAAMQAVRNAGDKGNIEGRTVYNELLKRSDLAMDIENPPQWVNFALTGSYLAHLGLAPSYYLNNLLQTPIITTPWLAARHGLGNTTIALTKALADTKDILKFSHAKGTGHLNWRFEFDWSDKFPDGSGEHELFKQMLERNKLDVTIENDLVAVAEARNGKLRDAMKAFNTPVRSIELVNRSTTALAAYRLGLKKFQGDQQKAINHAIRAVNDTQFDYSTLNASRYMQSILGSKSLARVVMQFRKFQQGVAYLLISNAYDAVKAEDIETKREARKTLLGLFITTGLLSGSLGFPAAGTAMFIANMIGQRFDDDDDPFDAETAWKNFLSDHAGTEVGAVLAKGLPVAFGVDLSKNVGLGDVLSPVPFYRTGSTGKESTGNMLVALGGAPVSTVSDIWDGIYKLSEGDFGKGVEQIVPLKLAKDVLRSIRYSDDGMTDSRGNTVLTADEFNPWDLALRAMGFKSTKESNYYEANQAVNDAYYAMMTTRNRLIHEATKDGIQVTDDIRDFNARHPQNQITYATLRKSLKEQRSMAQQRTSYGVYASKQKKPFLEEARFAKPEDNVDTEDNVATEYQ